LIPFLFFSLLAVVAFDHSEWDQFLKKFVNEKGEVSVQPVSVQNVTKVKAATIPGSDSMELGIQVGRGYVAGNKHPEGVVPADALPLDAAFSPIQRVTYNVEMSRLGQVIDYEKLVLEIWTNGAITPEGSVLRAAAHLREHFSHLATGRVTDEEEALEAEAEYLRETLGKNLDELALPARVVNALKHADVVSVADLVQKTEAEVEQVKNLGEKSLEEIKAALAGLGLSLGMRIDPAVLGAMVRGGLK